MNLPVSRAVTLLLVLTLCLAPAACRRQRPNKKVRANLNIGQLWVKKGRSISKQLKDPSPTMIPVQAPYTDETIRFANDGNPFGSGYVEVYRAGRWGQVCSDRWDLTDATVACRHLGFTSGAESFSVETEDLSWLADDADMLMDEVTCDGEEQKLHLCRYATRAVCSTKKPAYVKCSSGTDCPPNWLMGHGKCYQVQSNARNMRRAAAKCAKVKGELLSIDSVEDNHFLSDLLSKFYPEEHEFYTGGLKAKGKWVWLKPSKKKKAKNAKKGKKGKKRSRPSVRRVPIKVDRWFPGWPSHSNVQAEPSAKRKSNCLVLSNSFNNPYNKTSATDYFFWKAVMCPKKGLKHFLCQREAKKTPVIVVRAVAECYNGSGADYRGIVSQTDRQTPCLSWAGSIYVNPVSHRGKGLGAHNYCRNPDDDSRPWCWVDHFRKKFGYCEIPRCSNNVTKKPPATKTVGTDCYTGDGSSYRGPAVVTARGTTCARWVSSFVINPFTHRRKGLGNHNYCRNPDASEMPWCWVDPLKRVYGYCGIPKCIDRTNTTTAHVNTTTTKKTTTTTTTTVLPDLNCPSDEFYCKKDRRCISGILRCDHEHNCSDRSDEAGCDYVIGRFSQRKQRKLFIRRTRGIYIRTYIQLSNETCAKLCLVSKSFACKSFIYSTREHRCSLSPYDTSDGSLQMSRGVDYYELKTQSGCGSLFKCSNGLCVNKSLVCNGQNDCKDFSDELYCNYEEDATPEVEVNLIGDEEHSGTVELTYMGTTGIICGRSWNIENANVVCRMLGYSTAADALITDVFDYSTFLRNPVFILDKLQCYGNETSIEECPSKPWGLYDCSLFALAGVECQISKVCDEEQFKCANDVCVKTAKVCDGKDDCGDNSDERNCTAVEFQLVGGLNKMEGRVEIIRNGVSGTVCDDQWDADDATVVCRSLGFDYGGIAIKGSHFGRGSGPIWMDNVECSGDEANLTACSHQGWARHDCSHAEDASVKCLPKPTTLPPTTTSNASDTTPTPTTTTTTTPTTTTSTTTTTTTTTTTKKATTLKPALTTAPTNTTKTPRAGFKIQLVGGSNAGEGNVEIIIKNRKFRICDDDWDDFEATVICRMLGYSKGGKATTRSRFGSRGYQIILDNVKCTGKERDLTMCLAIVGINRHNCGPSEYAGVICKRDTSETNTPAPITRKPDKVTPTDSEGTCGLRPYDYKRLYDRKRRSVKRDTASASQSAAGVSGYPIAQRVIGGNYADHGQVPWQARLALAFSANFYGQRRLRHLCGAAIISEYWLLSAAHCFRGKKKYNFRVFVGDHDKTTDDKGEQMFEIDELFIYPSYVSSGFDYDMAVIKINPKDGHGIQFNDFVRPICLPTSKTVYSDGKKCLLSGWGNTGNSNYPNVLKVATVPLINSYRCNRIYNPFYARGGQEITNRMVCAGYTKGGADACEGDSGGPLACKVGDAYTLFGLTSWGSRCGNPDTPGVFVRVSYFTSWIKDTIKKNSDKEEAKLPRKP